MQLFLKNFFSQVDQVLFQYVDKVKASSAYLKMTEKIGSMDEDYRNYLNQSVTVFLLVIPFVTLFISFFYNQGIKNNIEVKREILNKANKIISLKRNLNLAGQQVFSNKKMSSKSDFQNAVTQIANNRGILLESLDIKNFKTDSSTPSIQKSNALLNFKNLNLAEFSGLIQDLSLSHQILVSSINIKKEQKNKTLSGTLEMLHLGKAKK